MATSFYLVRRSEWRDIGRLMGAEADETLIFDSLEAAALRRRTVLPSSARTSRIHGGYRYPHLLDEGLVMDGHGLNVIGRVPSLPRLFSSGAAGSMLKTELYHDDDDQDHCTTCCAVCLEEFCDGMEVSRLPCCHVFHGVCIGKWLLRKNSCPMCRRELHC